MSLWLIKTRVCFLIFFFFVSLWRIEMRSGDAGDADGLADYPEGRGGGRDTGLQIHAEPLRHWWTWHRMVCDQPGHNTERSDGKKKNKSSTKNISHQFSCRGNSNGPEKGRSVFLFSSLWLSHTVNIIWIININTIITALYSTQNKTKIFPVNIELFHILGSRGIFKCPAHSCYIVAS